MCTRSPYYTKRLLAQTKECRAQIGITTRVHLVTENNWANTSWLTCFCLRRGAAVEFNTDFLATTAFWPVRRVKDRDGSTKLDPLLCERAQSRVGNVDQLQRADLVLLVSCLESRYPD